MYIIFIALAIAAIVLIFKHKLPRRFPWPWALALLFAFLNGATYKLGTIERFYLFGVFLAAVIVGSYLAGFKWIRRAALAFAIGLALFMVADAVRLIPTNDIVITPGELQLGGLIRRPYTLTHPNLAAAWSLLLPFGAWTIVTVFTTQSRGALIGLLAALAARFASPRMLVRALPACAVLVALAVYIRPGTALDRLNFWHEGIDLFAARPLAGWGSGSYVTSLEQGTPAAEAMNAVTERTGMHTAHNALITIMAENGLIGLVAFAGLVLNLFFVIRK